jgi:hypothetical protein
MSPPSTACAPSQSTNAITTAVSEARARMRVSAVSKAASVTNASAMAGEVLNAMPTVQSYTQEIYEADRFGAAVETARRKSAVTRSPSHDTQ